MALSQPRTQTIIVLSEHADISFVVTMHSSDRDLMASGLQPIDYHELFICKTVFLCVLFHNLSQNLYLGIGVLIVKIEVFALDRKWKFSLCYLFRHFQYHVRINLI